MSITRKYRARTVKSLLLATAIALSGCEDERLDGAQSVLAAFQGSCISRGRWSDAAIQNTVAIQSIVQSLRDNDACKKLGNSLSIVSGLAPAIQANLTSASFKEARELEETLQELSLSLSQTNDSTTQTMLATALVQTQIKLASAKADARIASETEEKDRYAQATLQLASYSQTLLAQNSDLLDCLNQSPAAAVQLASNVASLGGNFISPVVGMGTSSLSQLIDIGISALRNSPLSRAKWSLYSAQMPLALKCGLESMTELYCNASDSFELLRFQVENAASDARPASDAWLGLDLIGRHMRPLNQWLLKIRNGNEPFETTDAERQNRIWRKYNALDIYRRDITAVINEDAQNYSRLTDPVLQENSLTQTIQNVIVKIIEGGTIPGVSASGGPYASLGKDTGRLACQLITGLDGSCPPYNNITPLDQYIRLLLKAKPIKPEDVRAHFKALHAAAEATVQSEFSQMITSDPRAILSAARAYETNNISPRESLSLLRRFILNLEKSDLVDATNLAFNPQLPLLVQTTRQIVERAIETVDSPAKTDVEAQAKLEILFKEFQLRQGIQFFNERMKNLVRWDLQHRLAKGELQGDVSAILRAASSDIEDRLLASGFDQLDNVNKDLNASRDLTASNIRVFLDLFEPALENILKDLKLRHERDGERARGSNRAAGQVLGELCALLVTTRSEFSQSPAFEYCRNAVFTSVHHSTKAPLELEAATLAREFEGKPAADRLCSMHRFMRESRLREISRGLRLGSSDTTQPWASLLR